MPKEAARPRSLIQGNEISKLSAVHQRMILTFSRRDDRHHLPRNIGMEQFRTFPRKCLTTHTHTHDSCRRRSTAAFPVRRLNMSSGCCSRVLRNASRGLNERRKRIGLDRTPISTFSRHGSRSPGNNTCPLSRVASVVSARKRPKKYC